LKKKNATPVAQSKKSLAKAKESKRVAQTSSTVLVAGLVGLMLAEEGYAATPNKSNEEVKGAKKSGAKKTADTPSKEATPNAEQTPKDTQAETGSRVVISGDTAEIAEKLSVKPVANTDATREGNNKNKDALENTLSDSASSFPSASTAPANNAAEIVFPIPSTATNQMSSLLQDEQSWLEQSLAKTSKGLGGIFFSEAPNTAAIVNVLQAENQWVNETIAKTAQGQGSITFPSLSTAGTSSIANLLNQESRQVDLANANAKPGGSIDFAQNLGDAKQSMANLFAGESITIAGGAGKGEVSNPNVSVQVADSQPGGLGDGSGISMTEIGLGVLGLALAAAGGGGGGGGGAFSAITGGSSSSSFSGYVIDGYIYNAEVYRVDASGNRTSNIVYTDSNGQYTGLTGGSTSDKIVVNVTTSSVDMSTNVTFTSAITLYASGDSTVINPITTMIQSYVDTYGGTTANAQAFVTSSLGISNAIDYKTYNPIASNDVTIQTAAAKVANVLISGTSALTSSAGSDAAASAKVLSSLVGQMVGGATVNLSDNTTLTTVLNNAASAISPGATINSNLVDILKSANTISATTLSDLYEVQKIVQNNISKIAGDATQLAESATTLKALVTAAKDGQKVMDVSLASGSDTGTSSTDRITKLANPEFKISLTGVTTAAVGDVVMITVDGAISGTHTLNAADLTQKYALVQLADSQHLIATPKTFTALVGTGLVNASTQATLTPADVIGLNAIDVSFSTAKASGFLAFTFDGVAPTAPVITTGPINTNQLTQIISGTAEALATVEIFDNGVSKGAVKADANGAWSKSVNLASEGVHVITASATDIAGNTNTVSGTSKTYTVDLVAPNSPDLTAVGAVSVSGGNAIRTNLLSQAFTGTSEANATVKVYDNGTLLGTTTAAGNGAWSLTQNLLVTNGTNTITVKAQDAAGNISSESTVTVIHDTVAPSVAVSASLPSLTNNATQTLSGIAESGATVRVYDNAVLVGTTTAVNGAWQLSNVSLTANASNTITATATDVAGNTSSISTGVSITVDTTAPTKPATPTLANDTGSSSTDKITYAGTVNVAGTTSETGLSWQYSKDGGSTWLNGTGSSFTVTGDASYNTLVRFTDLAGNTSTNSNALVFTLKTLVDTPVTTGLQSDTGSSASDKLTNTGAVNVTLEPVSTSLAGWQYSTNGGGTWIDGTLPVSGTTGVLTLSGDGAKSVIIRQTDLAGNTSSTSTPFTFTLDTTVAAPTLSLASDTGSSSSDLITQSRVVNVSLAGDVASWQYSTDSQATWTTGSGTSFTAPTGDGSKTVWVKQTDSAGNTSTASSLTFTLDTTAPTASFNAIAGDNMISADEALAAVTITGTTSGAENGQSVIVSFVDGVNQAAINNKSYVVTDISEV